MGWVQTVVDGAVNLVSTIVSINRRRKANEATSDVGGIKRQKKNDEKNEEYSPFIPNFNQFPSRRITATTNAAFDASSMIPDFRGIGTTSSIGAVASTTVTNNNTLSPSLVVVDDGSEASMLPLELFGEDNLSDNNDNELSVEEKLEEIYRTLVELGGQAGEDVLDQAQAQFALMERIMADYPHLKYNNRFVLALAVLCKSNDRSIRRGAERLLLSIDSQFIECAHDMISLIRSGIITVADGE